MCSCLMTKLLISIPYIYFIKISATLREFQQIKIDKSPSISQCHLYSCEYPNFYFFFPISHVFIRVQIDYIIKYNTDAALLNGIALTVDIKDDDDSSLDNDDDLSSDDEQESTKPSSGVSTF